MANNRMMLTCKNCGASMMLGKRMGSGYYTSWNKEEGAEYIERLSKFYDSHEWGHCTDKDVEHQLDCFEITYEHARQ